MENICPFQGCSEKFNNLLEAVRHLSFCQFSPMDCPVSCGTRILRKDLAAHLTVACKGLYGNCQFCGKVLMLDSLQQHKALCGVHSGVSCEKAKEQSHSMRPLPCGHEGKVLQKEEHEKKLDVYLPLLCGSVKDISLEMSQCRNLLKENLDHFNEIREVRQQLSTNPIFEEINSGIKVLSREKEDLIIQQKEITDILFVLVQQQAALSQLQKSTAEDQNLSAMLSNKIEDISNQHLVELRYIRSALEGLRLELHSGPTALSEDQGLERELKNMKKEFAAMKTEPLGVKEEKDQMKTELDVTKKKLEIMQKEQVDKEEMQTVKKELLSYKKEMDSMKMELQITKKELEVLKTILGGENEEIKTIENKLQITDKEMETLKTELHDKMEELETVKIELLGIKKELATVRTDHQTTTTTNHLDVKCQEFKNPVKMADVDLDLTLGFQNWLYDTYGYRYDMVDDYLYRGDMDKGFDWYHLFHFNDLDEIFQNMSKEVINDKDDTKFNFIIKWKVFKEQVEVEVSFYQSDWDINTLDQYEYFILEVGYTSGVLINSVLVGQTCRYLIDIEKLKKCNNTCLSVNFLLCDPQ